MCGIVGYIGTRNAYEILIKGLHRLEYRGYDSAGVALINYNDELNVYKAKGKVSDLETVAQGKDVTGEVGIAHTRWATHGEPSVRNAHPHVSNSGDLVIVHNGIIENFTVLRDQLKEKGFTFNSDTDTEVLVQLIAYAQQQANCSLAEAVRRALKRCIGAYAIAVLDRRDPFTLVAARKGSPMVVGIGQDNSEFFIASDATPIVEYTQNVVYVDDEQVVECHPGDSLSIIDLKNQPVDVDVKQIEMDLNMLDKGGFPHYMLKEIFDQPQCLRDCMRGRLFAEGDADSHEDYDAVVGHAGGEARNDVILSAVRNNRERLLAAKRLVIVACGTSWHAGLIAKQLVETYCKLPVEIDYASEFRYRDPVIYPTDVVIAISQSGETADTLAAIKLAKSRGAFLFGIVNAVGSNIARETHTGVYTHVGPEIGVASTKAFTGQLTCLTLFTLALAHAKGTISETDYAEMIHELNAIPGKIEQVLKLNDEIAQLSRIYTYATNFIYLGRGWNYPVALEGALKLKEISYIHAEGYPAAEMKHGPIALIDNMMPVLFVATHHQGYEKVLSNMQEVKARGGRIIAIVTEGDEEVQKLADQCISIPHTLAPLAPLLAVIPMQLLAYHIAVEKGLNVDMPRNLAKSVTVE